MKICNTKIKHIALMIALLNSSYIAAAPFEFDKQIDLGTLNSDNSQGSIAVVVSADGQVVVGDADKAGMGFHVFRFRDGDTKMTDLGTLSSNNVGYSYAHSVSADGRVIVGDADDADIGYLRAFRHNEGDARMTDLGTLRSNNLGDSYARSVSADGRVVVGFADTDDGSVHAFRHYEGDAKMSDLGTLRSDNKGFSYAYSVSADGRVIIGDASTDDNVLHAYRHNEGDAKMTDLGTLRNDNSGESSAVGVSADGRVVVGNASTDSNVLHAYRHNEGDAKMTDLGTLKSDNSGKSSAIGVSADGRIVVGSASTDSGTLHAYKHYEGDTKMTDLGTLRRDNGGASDAHAISADGRVVVGQADTDSGFSHAFKHTEASGLEDLGTLGGNSSSATAVSADGLVIVGNSDTADGNQHAFIYKNKMIDMVDSGEMLYKMAEQQTAALSFLQDKLTDALFQGCRPDANKTCFAAGAKYYQQSNHAVDDTAAYVNIAHSFHPKIYAGVYLEQSVSSGFADSIDANNEQPLMAIYGGFRPSGNQLGLQIRAAAATHKINVDITRPHTTNTEAGKGSSNFKGYSGQLEAAYVLQATNKMTISPVVGIRYSQVARGAYTEMPTVDFPAQYGKMDSKQTSLFAGVETQLSLSEKVDAYAYVGLEQMLDHSEEAFSAKAPYLGGLAYDDPNVRNTKAFAYTGLSYKVAADQKIGLGVGYRQSNFKSGRDSLSVKLGYAVQF